MLQDSIVDAILQDPDIAGYPSVDALSLAMITHVQELKKKVAIEVLQGLSYLVEDNPYARKLGFRCPVTGKVFSIFLTRVKSSPQANFFRTLAARNQVGLSIWRDECFPIALPEETND